MSETIKKKKSLSKVQDVWLEKPEFKDWLTKIDEFTVNCKICCRNFTIKYSEVSAINDHKKSNLHKTKWDAIKITQTLETFVTKITPKESDDLIISELCLTYHTVFHHLSYKSADCSIKLFKTLFKDSKICQNLKCGRTKMECLAENVLCPLSIEMHLKTIEDKCYSIASDASNKGNVKLFPIGIQYFDVKSGIVNFVLDFYEDPNETSEAIYNRIKDSVKSNGLSINKMVAFTGDNASVNYGKHHSVYQNLKLENGLIIKANCNCHVLHNTVEYALILLPFDIENLILKLYSHFSISAKRLQELKSCYDYCDKEFESMKRHVVTRWLSLYPAVCHIIDNITQIKSYFIGIGTDECPPILREFVWSENFNSMTICEMYLHFSAHLMKIFHMTIKTFEQKSTNATNLYDLMFKLKTQLQNRLNCEFFGSKVSENLKFFPNQIQNEFKTNAKNSYQRSIDYLIKNFDFDSSPFKLFSSLNLDIELDFTNICVISTKLDINIDKDLLFDEINAFNDCLSALNPSDKCLDTIRKYCKLLSEKHFPNLLKVVETVMAIPIGNDFVKRVFSHMRKVWTDQRNQMSVGLIKAEICIKNNFSFNCNDFKTFI